MPRTTDSAAHRLPGDILARITAAGLRRTLATRVVLGLFAAAPEVVLTHTQVAAQVRGRGLEVNRVTLYRLLDRLVACGALRRETDGDSRTWRFRLARDAEAEAAPPPRFECDHCHRHLRLEEGAGGAARAWADDLLARLAELGHHGTTVELAVHGICADCCGPDDDVPSA